MSIETRLRETGPRGGGGGGSSNSGGLAGTGLYYIVGSTEIGLPFSKVITPGANISFSTDATTLTINANTGGASNSAGLLGTGGYFFLGSANAQMPNSYVVQAGSSVTFNYTGSNLFISALTGASGTSAGLAGTGPFYLLQTSGNGTLPFSKVISAGSSVTTHTDSTNFYINAITSTFAGSAGLAGTGAYYLGTSANSTFPNWYVAQPGSSVTFNFTGSNLFISSITNAAGGVVYAPTGGPYIAYNSDSTLTTEKILTAGSSITVVTDATFFWINAITNTYVFPGTGGLAGTGNYYIVGSAQPLLPGSRILTAGSSISVRSDATSFYIDAITNTFAGSGGLASTGGLYVVTSASPLFPNSRIITAGSSVTVVTDATSIYISAITNAASANSGGLAGTGFYYIVGSSATGLPNSKVLTAGSSVTIVTDATAFYINAITNAGSSSAGLAGTGVYYLGTSANSTWPNWLVIQPGSSATSHITGSNYYINAITSPPGGVTYAPTGGPFITFTSDSTLTSELILRAGSSVTTRTDTTFFYIDAITSTYVFPGTGGLAGTGGLFSVYSASPLLPNSRIITAGSSVTVSTDATNLYITAITNTFAGSGSYYIVGSAQPLLPGSRILTAGSSITMVTDATAFYITAITNTYAGSAGLVGTGRTINTTYPLSGGGNLSADRTFVADTAFLVTSARTINTTFPLAGGGNLGADRTFTVNTAFFATSASFFITWSNDNLLSNERILTAGSSVTIVTDATSIYINAITNAAGGAIYAPTGGFYIAYNSDSALTAELILKAGSSVTTHTDATFFYINALTSGGAGNTNIGSGGFLQLPVQAAKLYSNDSSATIDAGTSTWRLLFSQSTQQYGVWQFTLPFDYSGSPAVQLIFSSNSSLSVARSVNWVVDQWGYGNSQSSIYMDTFAGANNTTIALSAGYSAGLVQIITVPLTNLNSFGAGNLIKLRVSSSAGNVTGLQELVGLGLYYRAGTQSIATGSAGLAGTGGPHISYAPGDPLFPNDRVLTSGSSTTVRTDSTAVYIDASTAGLAYSTDNFIVWAADGDLSNEKIMTAGEGISITTAATTITINALVKDENYYRNFATNTATALANAFYIGGGANNATALGTQLMAINTMTAVPFVVTKNMRIDTMAILATVTAAGCLIRLGLYSNSADNVLQPFQMISTSGQLVVTPNILTTFQVNQTLSANNLYWFILDVGTGAATVRTLPLAGVYPFLGLDSGLGTAYKVAINSGKLFSSGLPATWRVGYQFITMASIPAIAVRLSI